MATRDEVLRILIQIEGAGELERLIAELKQAAAEALPAQIEVLPKVSRQALMGRGGAAPRFALSEHLRMRRHMVCHFIAPSPELSPEQWAALCAERVRVGRALCDREARAVLEGLKPPQVSLKRVLVRDLVAEEVGESFCCSGGHVVREPAEPAVAEVEPEAPASESSDDE